MSDQDQDNHTKTKMGPLQFIGSVFVGVTISVTLAYVILTSIDQVMAMIDLILPYYIMIGFIFALSIMFLVRAGTRIGGSILFIQVVIMFCWLPLILIAFGMLIRDYLTDLEKAGDSQ